MVSTTSCGVAVALREDSVLAFLFLFAVAVVSLISVFILSSLFSASGSVVSVVVVLLDFLFRLTLSS